MKRFTTKLLVALAFFATTAVLVSCGDSKAKACADMRAEIASMKAQLPMQAGEGASLIDIEIADDDSALIYSTMFEYTVDNFESEEQMIEMVDQAAAATIDATKKGVDPGTKRLLELGVDIIFVYYDANGDLIKEYSVNKQ